MEGSNEFEGKDLEEALLEAAGELGIPEPDLQYEIVEQGRRGVLGLGLKKVRIRVLSEAAEATQSDDAGGADHDGDVAVDGPPDSELPAGCLNEIRTTAQRMIDLMGLEITASASARAAGVDIDLEGPDARWLLDRDGAGLSALQFLLNRMGRRSWPDALRIQVRCGGRGAVDPRDDDVVALAREVAQQVARTGRTKMLHPLNSYERRLVHLVVREFAGLTSSSDGAGALKRVRISKVRNTVA